MGTFYPLYANDLNPFGRRIHLTESARCCRATTRNREQRPTRAARDAIRIHGPAPPNAHTNALRAADQP
jgi:hypothetical protein